ncbi:phosphoribosylformylglycinamidine synthase subunit PurQ [Desulfohalobiaceae bacterium Ax17]|uniref:phosphoribosylformylglycinamidine synthase subunit PurQ n=1 Tax=Desulfovulcanus ferrireducens TaxID=2831190 RepID=UPI00207BAE40|nr:phosphoribosylformylglycinamidine synthase subunit PurQ [Desulfovulcanus ferrireducens]MBT8762476.1 phosphoribosylformylglycinamidine synthase subunit PurQ [Desulfovulcanus ferrireducens]
MSKVKVLVITGYGTNCERESAYAAQKAGAEQVDICFFSDLVAEKLFLSDYNFLIFPGGFLDGDDLGAAQAAALRWKYTKTSSGISLQEELQKFYSSGKLILGICNGFQLLVKLGLLPAIDGNYFQRQVSLSYNDSARFEDRWVALKCNQNSPCVFTKGLDYLYLPVRHGEGKIVAKDEHILKKLEENNLIALQYVHPLSKEPTQEYPYNPNGSPLAIAGLTDPSGHILGLMPHPEAYNHPTNHPSWTRNVSATLGTELIANGVKYLSNKAS